MLAARLIAVAISVAPIATPGIVLCGGAGVTLPARIAAFAAIPVSKGCVSPGKVTRIAAWTAMAAETTCPVLLRWVGMKAGRIVATCVPEAYVRLRLTLIVTAIKLAILFVGKVKQIVRVIAGRAFLSRMWKYLTHLEVQTFFMVT